MERYTENFAADRNFRAYNIVNPRSDPVNHDDNWGISDQYFVLDSWAKIESSNITTGELKFNTALQSATELYQFFLPSVPLLPYITNDNANNPDGTPRPVPDSQLPRLTINSSTPAVIDTIGSAQSMACFGGLVSIDIVELESQSTIGLNNAKYHWLCQTELSSFLTNVVVNPLLGREIFSFTKPIRDVTNMTVRLRNPDTGIMLLPDVLYGVTARIARNSSNEPVIEFYISTQNHNIIAGDRIFIDSINLSNGMGDPLFLKIDQYLNRPEGHLVGIEGSTSIDPNYLITGQLVKSSIRLNPDINLKDLAYINPNKYSPPAQGQEGIPLVSATRINILIAKNRIMLPLRMRKILPYKTNYKSA